MLQKLINHYSSIKQKISGNHFFDHKRAQVYEMSSADIFIKEHFLNLNKELQKVRSKKLKSPGIKELGKKGFYGGDKDVWTKISRHVGNKLCMELGPGPCGAMVFWWWVKRRIFIDPLLDQYREASLRHFGTTWYTDEMSLYSQPGEKLLKKYVHKVDGAIMCRNTLDHCENPYLVLENISKYAKKGCYLLLWTDLWHLKNLDEGHSNITNDKKEFEERIKKLGFKIEYSFDGIRTDGSTIEYGCRARKI